MTTKRIFVPIYNKKKIINKKMQKKNHHYIYKLENKCCHLKGDSTGRIEVYCMTEK